MLRLFSVLTYRDLRRRHKAAAPKDGTDVGSMSVSDHM